MELIGLGQLKQPPCGLSWHGGDGAEHHLTGYVNWVGF